jgi:hypothetical protein
MAALPPEAYLFQLDWGQPGVRRWFEKGTTSEVWDKPLSLIAKQAIWRQLSPEQRALIDHLEQTDPDAARQQWHAWGFSEYHWSRPAGNRGLAHLKVYLMSLARLGYPPPTASQIVDMYMAGVRIAMPSTTSAPVQDGGGDVAHGPADFGTPA